MIVAGDWKLGRALGSGATATVSLASTSSSGELFAVKSSHISRSAPLQREQSILCSLSSPYIITCLGSDVSGDFYHLFLELAAGGTLSDLAGHLDEPKIRSFTSQILLALCYLHSNGVSHCDIKGRNVLIGSDGRVKLGDFGSARHVEENEAPGVMRGTPAYMAPEVARGEEQGFSGDIWALGCTLVEMAGGGLPWAEVTEPFSAIHRIGFTSDVPVIPAWISEDGKDFVLKCFVRDPKQRWTAEQLLRHPFVAGEEESPLLSSSEKPERWVSPKSTLDFGLWELEVEVGEEEEEEEWDVVSERIGRLVSPKSAGWAWSGRWMYIRSSEEEEDGQNVWDSKEDVSFSGSDSMEIDDELVFSSSVSEMEVQFGTEDMVACCDEFFSEEEVSFSGSDSMEIEEELVFSSSVSEVEVQYGTEDMVACYDEFYNKIGKELRALYCVILIVCFMSKGLFG